MNRLIILGNGFDLAHGLPTSYKDFLFNYLKSGFIYAQSNGLFENKLVSINRISHYSDLKQRVLDPIKSLEELKKSMGNNLMKAAFKVDFCKGILEYIFEESNSNELWLDIEKLYYRKYREHFNNEDFHAIKELNDSLELLKEALSNYLVNNVENKWRLSTHMRDMYSSPFKMLMIRGGVRDSNKLPKRLFICNFNYTTLIKQYEQELRSFSPEMKSDMINIHGRLDEQDAYPLIFGYGNERDKLYQDILDLDDDEYTRHLKQSHYHLNDSYPRLKDFLRAGEFEVYIIGHSCGSPDATLLSEILEHEFCHQIVIFHHETRTNYGRIYNQINRKFSNKNIFRDRIVKFSEDNKCPQFYLEDY